MFGNHCVKSWATTQGIIAFSSGEAEYYGVVKAASIALGTRALFRDMGIGVGVEIHTDATAAKGIASRRGLGRVRHIDVQFLWVQEKVANGDFSLHKVRGEFNPADLLTKHVNRSTLERMMKLFNLQCMSGRSEQCPVLARDSR